MRRLDRRIHRTGQGAGRPLDCSVKPGNDNGSGAATWD
jgi:hypothetical protein